MAHIGMDRGKTISFCLIVLSVKIIPVNNTIQISLSVPIQCTKKCAGGTQKRVVKCLEPNLDTRQMKETDNCKYSERPPGFRQCNTHSCETTDLSNSSQASSKEDPKVNLIQNDITPGNLITPLGRSLQQRTPIPPPPYLHEMIMNVSPIVISECVDKFPNCHIVIRAQLCTYEYYINNCCAACKEATYGLQN